LRKIYFYDLGMRNALIDDFGPLELRGDVGALWENFVLVERLKKNQLDQRYTRSYYWRSRDKQEVDLVEESGGQFAAFECKWNKQPRVPGGFTAEYPNINVAGITKGNYWESLYS
jgi:predicted AAA+ superfamily ATPase